MGKKRVGLNVQNTDALLERLQHYYNLSVKVLQAFGGPSVYFHQQAIFAQSTAFLGDRHIEMIYATLSSWGMHRMGDPKGTKAKMVEFPDFRSSILECRNELTALRNERFEKVTPERYGEILQSLNGVYGQMKVSISKSTLVAHAKTLAHILPHLIPPIDRQYTVRFFSQDASEFFTKSGKYRLPQVPNGLDAQFGMFVELSGKMKTLFDLCDKRILQVNEQGFNTSYPKIVDNLIMAFVKSVKRPSKS
ncbi:MAG: hypothetical protein IPP35_07850 [Elusimicrobia bacterium]|nr:hypothetical protein [Elusimicrobiota bacterium]